MTDRLRRLQQLYMTEAEWDTENPTLYPGEIGFVSDTMVFKVGDGVTAWADLPFTTKPAGPTPGLDWTEIALVNPGFETGDFTGWIPAEANTPGNGEVRSGTPFAARTGTYFAWLDLAGQSLTQNLNLNDHLPAAALADGVALDFKAECYAKTTAVPDRLQFKMSYRNVNSNFILFDTQAVMTEISSVDWTLVESGTFQNWPTSAAVRGNNDLSLVVQNVSSGSLVRMGYDDFRMWWRYRPVP